MDDHGDYHLVDSQSYLLLRKTLFLSELLTQGHPKIMTDVRDYNDDIQTGIPTIPVLLASPLKVRLILTVVQAAVMVAFLHNPFIVASSCFAIALVWILGKDSPKVYFRFGLHSQSIFIVIYAAMSALSLL
jgi:4-hydroxybenzoate polyprenyltransferase